VTEVVAVTVALPTVNVAPVAPAGTVSLAGTVATAVSLLERDTVAPPLGAVALSVTAPVAGEPPVTVVGFSDKDVSVGPGAAGVTVNEAVCVVALGWEADTVTDVDAATGIVAIWKVAFAPPAATVTLPGTVAAMVSLLDNEMTAPPAGAGPPSVTVAVEELPPLTLVGFTAIELIVTPSDADDDGVPVLLLPLLQDCRIKEIATSPTTAGDACWQRKARPLRPSLSQRAKDTM
jgi:hypothetical protein